MTQRPFPTDSDDAEHLVQVVSQLYTIRSVIMLDIHRAGVPLEDLHRSHSLGLVNTKIDEARTRLDAHGFRMCINTMHKRCFF